MSEASAARIRLLALGLVVWFPALAQRFSLDAALHTSEKPYIQATGEATVSTKPDQAVIEIGVVSQAATANAASSDNAKQTEGVVAELDRLLDRTKKVKTVSYAVRPNFQYAKPGARPVIAGYIATNVVAVTLGDMSQIGKVIDAAMQSGANVVQKLQFRLKNPNIVRAQALREAAEQAKTGAEAMAAGLGLKVLRVISAEEVSDEEFGVAKKSPPPAPAGSLTTTPVEIGTIDTSVTVLVRVEVGP